MKASAEAPATAGRAAFTSTGTATVTATTGGGIANVALRSSTIAATATVKATAGGVSGEVKVTFSAVSELLSLSTSQTSVKSDNSDNATITATVLDVNRVPVKGAIVLFTATGGQISATSVETDVNGQAKILFSSGTVEKKNQTVTITASVTGLASKQIPIQIVGTTVTLSSNATTLEVGGQAASLTATVRDAGGVAIFDAAVTFTIDPSSTGNVIFSQTTAQTDVAGQAVITVTGSGAGNVTVRADSLGATATIAYTVSNPGDAFGIIDPVQDPYSMRTRAAAAITGPSNQIAFADSNPDTINRADGGDFTADGFATGDRIMVGGSGSNDGVYTLSAVAPGTLTVTGNLAAEGAGAQVTITNSVLITVRAPSQANVQFATTLGAWDNGGLVVNKAVDPVTDEVSAVLSSANAGVATVQVSDAANPGINDSMTVVFSAPPSEAAQLALQASATVVAPSTGDTKNTVSLTATVKNAGGQVVGGAPVAFSIINPTGGGESISPVIVYTDNFGVAQSTFTSGSLSSGGQGVTVKAEVVGSPLIFDDVQIVIGGTAGSVVLGRSTKIESVENNTAYQLPMSVLVLDSNGNPVPGAIVSLGTWPASYTVGGWAVNATPPPACIPTSTYTKVVTGVATPSSVDFTDNNPNLDTITRPGSENFVTDGFSTGNRIRVVGVTPNIGTYTLTLVTPTTITLSPGDNLTTEAGVAGITITTIPDVYPNEDVNRNLILDFGEDVNGDNELTPPNSSSGAVPAPVTTDETGVGNFNLVYLKAHAAWIETEITASVMVLGTETRSTLIFWLPFAEDDACDLPASPFTAP